MRRGNRYPVGRLVRKKLRIPKKEIQKKSERLGRSVAAAVAADEYAGRGPRRKIGAQKVTVKQWNEL
jgi:hypothetical protein